MKVSKLLLRSLLLLLPASSALAGEEVDRLLAGYSNIDTVTCQIRRTKKGELGKMTFLSRVYWTGKDQLHAEGIAPMKRRTIVDGKRLWQYVEGDPKGFSRPIEELSDQMIISLKMVPGTAMDHLLRLKGLEEQTVPDDDAGRKRIGIRTDAQYVLLSLDDKGRLIRLQFFKTPAMNELMAQYDYSDFTEAAPDSWVPLKHMIIQHGEKSDFEETVKIDRYIANKPVATSLFIASSFFDKDVDFVDDFAKIYPESKGMREPPPK